MAAKTILADVCEHKKAGELYFVNPEVIRVIPGWNSRKDFSGEDELVESIKEEGVLVPLKVRKTVDKQLELISGERRLRASLRARAEGADVLVPVKVENSKKTDAELFFSDVCSNSGKPLLPIEEAEACLRAFKWGYSPEQIAVKFGRSVAHIRNRLELAQVAPDVKAAVDAGEISIGAAQDIAKDRSIDGQQKALKKKKAAPKKRKQVFRIKGGAVKHTGYKETVCEPIRELFSDSDLLERIKSHGFDPETIRLTIDPVDRDENRKEQ